MLVLKIGVPVVLTFSAVESIFVTLVEGPPMLLSVGRTVLFRDGVTMWVASETFPLGLLVLVEMLG